MRVRPKMVSWGLISLRVRIRSDLGVWMGQGRSLGFCRPRRRLRVVFEIIMWGNILLKPSTDNETLSWVAPRGTNLLKCLGWLRVVLLKLKAAKSRLAPGPLGSSWSKSLGLILRVSLKRSSNQFRANLALRPGGPVLGVEPCLAPS
jgi:hypothetical protein